MTRVRSGSLAEITPPGNGNPLIRAYDSFDSISATTSICCVTGLLSPSPLCSSSCILQSPFQPEFTTPNFQEHDDDEHPSVSGARSRQVLLPDKLSGPNLSQKPNERQRLERQSSNPQRPSNAQGKFARQKPICNSSTSSQKSTLEASLTGSSLVLLKCDEAITLMRRSSGGAAALRRLLVHGGLDPNQTVACEDLTIAAARMTMLQNHFAARPRANSHSRPDRQPVSLQQPFGRTIATQIQKQQASVNITAAGAAAIEAVSSEWSLLCAACYFGDPGNVDTLLRAGADAGWSSPYGLGPVAFAIASPSAGSGERLAIVQMLLSRLRPRTALPDAPSLNEQHQRQGWEKASRRGNENSKHTVSTQLDTQFRGPCSGGDLFLFPGVHKAIACGSTPDAAAFALAAWPPALRRKCQGASQGSGATTLSSVATTARCARDDCEHPPDAWWLVIQPLVLFMLQEESRSASAAMTASPPTLSSASQLPAVAVKPVDSVGTVRPEVIHAACNSGRQKSKDDPRFGLDGGDSVASSREEKLVELLVSHGATDPRLLRASSLLTLSALARRSRVVSELLAPVMLRRVIAEAGAQQHEQVLMGDGRRHVVAGHALSVNEEKKTSKVTLETQAVPSVGAASTATATATASWPVEAAENGNAGNRDCVEQPGPAAADMADRYPSGRIFAALLQHALVQPPGSAGTLAAKGDGGSALGCTALLQTLLDHGVHPFCSLWPGGPSVVDLLADTACPQQPPPLRGAPAPSLETALTDCGSDAMNSWDAFTSEASFVAAARNEPEYAQDFTYPEPSVTQPDPNLLPWLRQLLSSGRGVCECAGGTDPDARPDGTALGGWGVPRRCTPPLVHRLATRLGSSVALSALELLLGALICPDDNAAVHGCANAGGGSSTGRHIRNPSNDSFALSFGATSSNGEGSGSINGKSEGVNSRRGAVSCFSADYVSTRIEGVDMYDIKGDETTAPGIASVLQVAASVRNLDALRTIATRLLAGPRPKKSDQDTALAACIDSNAAARSADGTPPGGTGFKAASIRHVAEQLMDALEALRCYVVLHRSGSGGKVKVITATTKAKDDVVSAVAACRYCASGTRGIRSRAAADGHIVDDTGPDNAIRVVNGSSSSTGKSTPAAEPSDVNASLNLWEGYTYTAKVSCCNFSNPCSGLTPSPTVGDASGYAQVPDNASSHKYCDLRRQQQPETQQQQHTNEVARGIVRPPAGRQVPVVQPSTGTRWSLVAVAVANGTCCLVTSSDKRSDLNTMHLSKISSSSNNNNNDDNSGIGVLRSGNKSGDGGVIGGIGNVTSYETESGSAVAIVDQALSLSMRLLTLLMPCVNHKVTSGTRATSPVNSTGSTVKRTGGRSTTDDARSNSMRTAHTPMLSSEFSFTPPMVAAAAATMADIFKAQDAGAATQVLGLHASQQ